MAKTAEEHRQRRREYYHENKEYLRQKQKEYHQRNKDTINKRHREYSKTYLDDPETREHKYKGLRDRYRTPNGKRRVILSGIKSKCKRAGLDFDLDLEWMEDHWNDGRCEVSNVPYKLDCDPKNRSPFCPSVDRINHHKGYTKDNCRLVCWGFNAMKAQGTDEDVRDIVRGLWETGFQEKK